MDRQHAAARLSQYDTDLHEAKRRRDRDTAIARHQALLIQRELLAEKEVFRNKRSPGAQAEPQETPGINQQWQQRREELEQSVDQA